MSFATEDPDEPKRRVRKSRKKKKTKRRAHSSESRKRLEESDFSLDIEQSAKSKAYSKRDSGVESVASGGDDSYDLDSRASAYVLCVIIGDADSSHVNSFCIQKLASKVLCI